MLQTHMVILDQSRDSHFNTKLTSIFETTLDHFPVKLFRNARTFATLDSNRKKSTHFHLIFSPETIEAKSMHCNSHSILHLAAFENKMQPNPFTSTQNKQKITNLASTSTKKHIFFSYHLEKLTFCIIRSKTNKKHMFCFKTIEKACFCGNCHQNR